MEENKKKKKSVKNILSTVVLIILLFTSGYLVYTLSLLGPVEPLIRTVISGAIIVIDLIFLIKFITKRRKGKKKVVAFTIIALLLSIIYSLISLGIGYLYGSLAAINKDYITYTSSLIVLNDSSVNELSDLSDMSIGILSNTDSPDGYIIPKEVIYENKLNESNDVVEINDYPSLMANLYSGELDAIFITSNYPDLFKTIEGYEDVDLKTRVIMSEDKKLPKVKDESSALANNDKSLEEPFSVLIMGIDSATDGLENSDSHNGDALILVTFNPKTLNATVLSIPRDSYVPIACFSGQIENKITHASWNGTECMIDTIENFTDVEIDYYVKMNFKGLVDLVDAVGGIDVYVPTDMCTDDSDRGVEICINEGQQVLNGEEALVLSRNRKAFTDGDISRGLNQQVVIEGIINSASSINSAEQIITILETVSKNMDTNFSEKQILSFYNIFMSILANSSIEGTTSLNLQQLFLSGTGQTIYDEGIGLNLWNYVLTDDSVSDVSEAMKVNLGILEPEMIKEFSFSINQEYTAPIIGEGPYDRYNTYTLLPNFVGSSKSYVQSWANKYGVKVSFIEKESTSKEGSVISQSLPANKRIDKINGTLSITIAKSIPKEVEKEEPQDNTNDDNNSSSSNETTEEQTDN